jgi:mono/diheme cytochrome c family protein
MLRGTMSTRPNPSGHWLATSLMDARLAVLLLTALAAGASPVQSQAQTRGELLYSTHCVTCHTTQMHWRDQRLATDWNSLKALVKRWQGVAALDWSEADILEVTRHLNDRIYKFEPAAVPISSLPRPALAHRS